MGITFKEYFDKRKEYKKFCDDIQSEIITDTSVEDFYEHFVSKTVLDPEIVNPWHKMLKDYISRDDAILLCRLYENDSNKHTYEEKSYEIDRIRRSALTILDGMTCVFVSNYDAAEFFNMIKKGVIPDIDLFKQMLSDHSYGLHYQNREPIEKEKYLEYINNNDINGICKELEKNNKKTIQEEFYISAGYPAIGTVRASVLNASQRYLAHIIGVKDTPYFFKESGKMVPGEILSVILPRGKITDWGESSGGEILRTLDKSKIEQELKEYDISLEEAKRIIRAHFLRFFDPVNYFATPSKNYHTKESNMGEKSNIGEYWRLQEYVEDQYQKKYGKEVMDDFRERALVPPESNQKFKKIIKKDEIVVKSISYGKGLKEKPIEKMPSSTTKEKRSSKEPESLAGAIDDYKAYLSKTIKSVSSYASAIRRLLKLEGISVKELEKGIDTYIIMYGPKGLKQKENRKGDIIAAIKKYKEFVDER